MSPVLCPLSYVLALFYAPYSMSPVLCACPRLCPYPISPIVCSLSYVFALFYVLALFYVRHRMCLPYPVSAILRPLSYVLALS